MSAVDAPPGLAFAGLAAGEFVARVEARRLAKIIFFYVTAAGMATWMLCRRYHWFKPGIEMLLAAPVLFMGIGLLGYAVRAARVRVDAAGVRLGWARFGFRLSRGRIRQVVVYDDAVAVSPTRGSIWYLAHRDWRHFEEVAAALRRAGIAFERTHTSAPLRARLHSFGFALDGLLIVDAIGATFALAVAGLL
jgi:hypothetical protein